MSTRTLLILAGGAVALYFLWPSEAAAEEQTQNTPDTTPRVPPNGGGNPTPDPGRRRVVNVRPDLTQSGAPSMGY